MTYGPSDCIKATQILTNVVDNILINKSDYTDDLQSVFGLQGLTYATDFANVLSNGIGGWQSQNWDPALNSESFDEYCGNVSSDRDLYNTPNSQSSTVKSLLDVAGYGADSYLVTRMNNYIGWIKTTRVDPCTGGGETADGCFSTHNSTFYAQDDISQTWRSWPYQYCTEWGFLQTGSGFKGNGLPVISRTLDLDFQSKICQDAFNITTPANVSIINAYGGYDISYDRLAFVDGQADPWIGATVHAVAAPPRANTTKSPSIVIPGAIHHWDENGIFVNESTAYVPPGIISYTQDSEAYIVRDWLRTDWTSGPTYYSRIVVGGAVGLAAGNKTAPPPQKPSSLSSNPSILSPPNLPPSLAKPNNISLID